MDVLGNKHKGVALTVAVASSFIGGRNLFEVAFLLNGGRWCEWNT